MFVKRKKTTQIRPAEQRVHQRFQLNVEVTIDSEHNFYCGLSQNISEGGLFIATFQTVPLGTELDLSFTLPPGTGPLAAPGKVQWVREFSPQCADLPPGMGVRFIDPSPELIAAVRAFTQGREPTYYDD